MAHKKNNTKFTAIKFPVHATLNVQNCEDKFFVNKFERTKFLKLNQQV